MRILIALAVLCFPLSSAVAGDDHDDRHDRHDRHDWHDRHDRHDWRGGGFGVFIGPPPIYYAPPVYYASACYAGPVTCPLYGRRPAGAPCHCRSGYGVYHGRAG